MSSWSIFRRIRITIFVLVTLVSLVLTVLYSLFISKDFSRYNNPQRWIVAASAALNGIAAILVYLMIVVQYNAKLDAARVTVLLGLQTTTTTLFTLRINVLPCTAFNGGSTCRQAATATSILSWVFCGLLVAYWCCLAITFCIPQPLPMVISESRLDVEAGVNTQARHATPLYIDSRPVRRDYDASEKSPYSAVSWVDTHTGSAESVVDDTRIRLHTQQQMEVQRNASISSPSRSNAPSGDVLESEGSAAHWSQGDARHTPSVNEGWPSPPSYPYVDRIPRPLTPGSMYTSSLSSSSSILLAGARSTTQPPPQRMQNRSLSNSVHSIAGTESGDPPLPVTSTATHRIVPGRQSILSIASWGSDSSQWKQLVQDAAAGRRSETY